MCRLVDCGSGNGLGMEKSREDLSRAPPGETVRPPIATRRPFGELNWLAVLVSSWWSAGVELRPTKIRGCLEALAGYAGDDPGWSHWLIGLKLGGSFHGAEPH